MALIRFLRDTISRRRELPLPRTQSEINRVIEAHLAGDPRAFGRIVARYQNRLINFVYRMVGDRDRAEELVQDTFLRVHRHLHRFDRERNFSTWIYTIAANLARNELRRRSACPIQVDLALHPVCRRTCGGRAKRRAGLLLCRLCHNHSGHHLQRVEEPAS